MKEPPQIMKLVFTESTKDESLKKDDNSIYYILFGISILTLVVYVFR